MFLVTDAGRRLQAGAGRLALQLPESIPAAHGAIGNYERAADGNDGEDGNKQDGCHVGGPYR